MKGDDSEIAARGTTAQGATVEISLRRIAYALGAAIAVVSVAGLIAAMGPFLFGADPDRHSVELFDLGSEGNLPSWFSSSMLLLNAVLAALIAGVALRRQAPFGARWAVIAFLMLYISADETIGIHEEINARLRFFENVSGIFFYAWVVPAGFVVLALTIWYWPLVRSLPAPARQLTWAAAGSYVGGALIVELGLGQWTSVYGYGNIGWGLINGLQEIGEMAGLGLYLMALLHLIAGPSPVLRVSFGK
ncbi:MAG: hypothetical protein HOK61_05820 [Alphaproteobacteria bacterium]|jgi:hypothetical protein|nr:hypothetical protein [Alphaproteobacteria bacterium]